MKAAILIEAHFRDGELTERQCFLKLSELLGKIAEDAANIMNETDDYEGADFAVIVNKVITTSW